MTVSISLVKGIDGFSQGLNSYCSEQFKEQVELLPFSSKSVNAFS